MEQPPNIWILTSGETKSSATLMQLQRLRTYKDRVINISGGGVGRCWNCTRTSDREALLKSNKFEYYIEYIMCCKLIYKPCARTHKHTHTNHTWWGAPAGMNTASPTHWTMVHPFTPYSCNIRSRSSVSK